MLLAETRKFGGKFVVLNEETPLIINYFAARLSVIFSSLSCLTILAK